MLLFETFNSFKFFSTVDMGRFDDMGSDQISAKSQLLTSNSVNSLSGKNIRGEICCSWLPAKFNCVEKRMILH